MGSFRTTVEMEGKSFDCLFSSVSVFRNIDDKGRVSSGCKGGKLKMRIESTEDHTVITQMINKQFTPFDGSIVFMKADEESELKRVDWRGGYVIHFTEQFDADNEEKMTIYFEVSAEVISFSGAAEQDNRWPKA